MSLGMLIRSVEGEGVGRGGLGGGVLVWEGGVGGWEGMMGVGNLPW